MARWTVTVGPDDVIVVERTGDGTWVIDIPSRRPVLVTREQIEDLRLKLGAAIADPGDVR